MTTFIKAGLWDNKSKGYKGELDLNLLIKQNAPSAIGVNGNSLYSVTPLAGPNISPYDTIALGREAGKNATDAGGSNFLGYYAGQDAFNASNSNFLGQYAGYSSSFANYSNFLGYSAGKQASNANDSNFLGRSAGSNATNAQNSNFLGLNAGLLAYNAYNSNFLGQEAGMNSTGNNVNAFGYRAHKGGTLSGQTVFSNNSLPSYTNRAAATTAITVPNGAVAGNTYLYYNQTTFAIEAVRL